VSDTRHLAHRNDPATSHIAAASATGREAVKGAIVTLIREWGASCHPGHPGLAAHEARDLYGTLRDVRGWPIVQPHSIPRRMSELHNEHIIFDTGARVETEYGRPAVVWGLTGGTMTPQDLTPAEAAKVAAFGLDRPEDDAEQL
jgi:hypothetical protein